MIGNFFDLVLINPLTNLFVLLTALTGSAGVAVILLTIMIRIATLPMTLKQMKTTRAMGIIAPRLQELQKRYKDPKRRSQEQMRLYKEAGVNPLGCITGMLLQFPILIALYAVFQLALGTSPEALVALSDRLYNFDILRSAVPLPDEFLWLNLGERDPFVIPVTVAITTYVLQKMSSLPAMDEKQQAQQAMMNMLMPLIFGWITLTLPSGLGLYYVLSNIIGMVMQYAYVGGGPVNWRGLLGLNREPVLPRALEVRQSQIESLRRAIPEDDGVSAQSGRRRRGGNRQAAATATQEAVETQPETAAQRRRRYANGRRRGRR